MQIIINSVSDDRAEVFIVDGDKIVAQVNVGLDLMGNAGVTTKVGQASHTFKQTRDALETC